DVAESSHDCRRDFYGGIVADGPEEQMARKQLAGQWAEYRRQCAEEEAAEPCDGHHRVRRRKSRSDSCLRPWDQSSNDRELPGQSHDEDAGCELLRSRALALIAGIPSTDHRESTSRGYRLPIKIWLTAVNRWPALSLILHWRKSRGAVCLR